MLQSTRVGQWLIYRTQLLRSSDTNLLSEVVFQWHRERLDILELLVLEHTTCYKHIIEKTVPTKISLLLANEARDQSTLVASTHTAVLLAKYASG